MQKPDASVEPVFQLLFEGSPHPYLVLGGDPGFTIVAVNNRYLTATGTHRSNILGRGLFEVFPDNPDDHSVSGVSDLRASLERVLHDRAQDIMGVQKYDIPRQDGTDGFEVKYWSPVNTPVFSVEGDIAYIIHHVEDVTEFILMRERAPSENTELIERVEERAERMEAEVLRRATEVKDANRKLKATMEELEQREAELARLNERLQELDRAKTDFFSNVSHEFRTPLTLMLGPLKEALGEPDSELTQDVRNIISTAHRNALRLLKLVNTLLDFSRIEAGRARAAFEPTNLASFTAALASHFQSACASAALKLVIDCPVLPEQVYVDRQMWEKIVLNLISNAFKFTFEGLIEVSLRAEEGVAVLTVRDTGTGIPEKELPWIFERFHRVEGSHGRSYEGSGIGLALVSELVKLHKGTIHVESEIGHGSTFTVRLPLGADHLPKQSLSAGGLERRNDPAEAHAKAFVEEALLWLPETVEPSAAERDEGGSIRASKGRILVVDDNADMRAYIRRLLKAAGYEVEDFTEGAAAIAACMMRSPDLVLSDVMMPVMSGFELLRHLRSGEQTAVVPVILLSARAGEEARVDGLASGADDYIVKPFSATELVARVDGAIRLARVRHEAEERKSELLKKLLHEEELAANVFRNIMEGVFVTETDGTIISVNPSCCSITGYQADEMVGQNPRLLKSNLHDAKFYEEMWRQLKEYGTWQGEIWNRRKDGATFLIRSTITAIRDDKGLVLQYVAVFNDITQMKQKEEFIRHQAYHDALTNLPNRALFLDRLTQELAHARRDDQILAVMFVDLDRFKNINDTLGHDVGDLLLRIAARRLTDCVRESDTVARMGGDEFTIILGKLTGASDAVIVAKKILQQLSLPFLIKRHEINISGSIGISLYPRDGADVASLLKNADTAMYSVKQRGRSGYCLYSDQI